MKRETVRINVPGKAPAAPNDQSPKKESSKISNMIASGAAAPTPPSGAKLFVPPPPGAPAGTPVPATFSGAAGTPPPKPPSLSSRPTVPLKPGSPFGGPTPAPAPVAVKAAPKKETARITLPTEGGKPVLPKATVKMQQTQPLVSRPAPALTSAAVTHADTSTSNASSDPSLKTWAIATLVVALGSAVCVYMIYSAALARPFAA